MEKDDIDVYSSGPQIRQRLDNIEEVLKQVNKILIELARLESRMSEVLKAIKGQSSQIDTLYGRVNELEKDSIRRHAVSTRVERFIWLFIGGLFAMGLGLFSFWVRG